MRGITTRLEGERDLISWIPANFNGYLQFLDEHCSWVPEWPFYLVTLSLNCKLTRLKRASFLEILSWLDGRSGFGRAFLQTHFTHCMGFQVSLTRNTNSDWPLWLQMLPLSNIPHINVHLCLFTNYYRISFWKSVPAFEGRLSGDFSQNFYQNF